MGEEWKELDTGKKFWSEFNEAQNLGQSVRIEKAEGNPEYERNKKIFNNARKVVQKKLEEKKLVDYLVTSPIDALRYAQMICEPLDRKQRNIKDLEDDHVLYGLSNHTMMDLTDEKRIVSLDKFLRKVIKEDDEQGGVKQQSLREMADLEERLTNKLERYKELEEKSDELKEDSKTMMEDLDEVLGGIKNLAEDVISKALFVIVRNIRDIRRKQNERIEKEKQATMEEAKKINSIWKKFTEGYGDSEEFKKKMDLLTKMNTNQQERMNKESLAGDMRSLIYNLEKKVEDINEKQEERLAKESRGLQKSKDARQDKNIEERRKKDDVHDDIIAKLEARIDKLERESDSR
jgi:hypothetical protein